MESNMKIEPYKSLRTIIIEVQQAQATATKPKSTHKNSDVWQTASGSWAAKNKTGATEYFDTEENAKAWLEGKARPAGATDKPGDTSVAVKLDQNGNEPQPSKETSGASQAKEKVPVSAKPQTQGTAPTTSAPKQAPTASQTSQPNATDKEEHPEVSKENPKTEFSSAMKVDPKATAQAQAKPDIRKANVLAKAIKEKKMAGPQSDEESIFGDAQVERNFIDQINHASLSAMRGGDAYDFELCSPIFKQVGFCFDPKQGGRKVSKGIVRTGMPQFASQVDPSKKDSEAYKALMRGKNYTSPDQVTPEDLKSEVNLEKQYREALESSGYSISEEDADVTSLKPIQGELKGEKVASMYGTLAAAEADPTNYGKSASRLLEPIYVCDGHVIDGHHRWAAQVAIDIANGKGANTKMKVRNITKKGKPISIDEIIKFSNDFQESMGLASQDRSGKIVSKKTSTEEKPKTEGYSMNKFGNKKYTTTVQTLHEAVKRKIITSPALGTIKYGIDADEDRTSHFSDAMKTLNPRKSDRFGNIKPQSKDKKATSFGKSDNAVNSNLTSASDLIATANLKPAGTTFEIYGIKNGKEYIVKVKKVRSMGEVIYMMTGNRQVELQSSGAGLQIVDKKNRRVILDRGNDMIWESADFLDVGIMSITE